MNTTPILRATNIVKKLGGKTILNDVSLDVHKGLPPPSTPSLSAKCSRFSVTSRTAA